MQEQEIVGELGVHGGLVDIRQRYRQKVTTKVASAPNWTGQKATTTPTVTTLLPRLTQGSQPTSGRK